MDVQIYLGGTMKSINPANNNLIQEYKEHTDAECDRIISQTLKAWESWRTTTFPHRKKLMKRAAKILRKNKEFYATVITNEMGKIIEESRAEVEKCAWVCDFYADNSESFLSDEFIKSDASKSFVAFEPLGPVLAIMPWNFPFWQVFRFAAPALMAGNAGLLKHASNVPGCALSIENVFKEAGFPANIFRSLLVGGSRCTALIKHEAIKAVTLTGSEMAGSQVATEAGKFLKKTVMELGGSDPFIILEDADLDTCIPVATQARMINCGQSCIAAKRFIVVKERLGEFVKRQKEMLENLKIGDPLNPNTQVAPLAREDILKDLHHQVNQSVEKGATLLTGGKRLDHPGFFYLPTLITDIKKGHSVYNEETFGPVMAVIAVKNEDEAVEVANDSRFGLGGSIWTTDLERGERLARKIETGAVFVNGMTKSDPRLPFGGIKISGYGRELSHYGIKEFVNIKTIWIS
jgi:succinate-semialdehyde dehydrogenase/glutarate-semialdehyde dehydrogenase